MQKASRFRLAAMLCSVLWASMHQATATNSIVATVECPYFNAQQDINLDGPNPNPDIMLYIKSYLQAYRFIRHRPRLAHRLMQQHPQLEKFSPLAAQLQKLGLTRQQIGRESSQVYTLHIMTYASPGTFTQFSRLWQHKHIYQHQIYKSQAKRVLLFLGSDGISIQDDPLFTEPIRFKGRKMNRLCYGIYENCEDAKRDVKVLARYLGQPLSIQQQALTTALVRRAWINE